VDAVVDELPEYVALGPKALIVPVVDVRAMP